MATFKVKFRPSTVEGREGTVYYRVIHDRVVRQIKTGYHLTLPEWEAYQQGQFSVGDSDGDRLFIVSSRIKEDLSRLSRIIAELDSKGSRYTSDDVVAQCYAPQKEEDSFFSFAKRIIAEKKQTGHIRASETYQSTLNSFIRFRKGIDLSPRSINAHLTAEYESYLKAEELCKNTISFYMRILRTIFNRAVEENLAEQTTPFKRVYTGIDKTVKRAMPLDILIKVKNLDLSLDSKLAFARDMFMFSFSMRGMSFIDMCYLKKSDLKNGVLTYKRKKTGQKLFIRWEPCMQEIVAKYSQPESPYLLSLIEPGKGDARKQYINKGHLINKRLKKIGERLELSGPLTMYVARHTWASVAKSKNIPISVISEGMGHDSEMTTQIYLASLDTSIVDEANELILGLLT